MPCEAATVARRVALPFWSRFSGNISEGTGEARHVVGNEHS